MSIIQNLKTVSESTVDLKSNCDSESDTEMHSKVLVTQVKAECSSEDIGNMLPENGDHLPTCCKLIESEPDGKKSSMSTSCSQQVNSIKTETCNEVEEDSIPSYDDTVFGHVVTDTPCERQDANFHHYQNHPMRIVPHPSGYEALFSNYHDSENKIIVAKHMEDSQSQCDSSSTENMLTDQQEAIKFYECETCPYSCSLLFELCQHRVSHMMDSFYVCDLCQSSYMYFLDLKSHLASHAAGVKKDGDEKKLFCNVCNDFSGSVHQHLSDDLCTFKADLTDNQRIKPYCCNPYDVACATPSKLTTHTSKHTGERPYSCDICYHNCAYENCVKRHYKVKHTSEKPYSCELCEFTCSLICDLKVHKRSHLDMKFSCDQCKYTSVRLYDLKRHKRIHSGEKPFSCDFCEFTCAHKSSLIEHQRRHSEEKPYSCEFCEYTCVSANILKKHKRRHTGEKPYSCEICEYTCLGKYDLKLHKRRHTGEKLYSCDLCEHTCATSSALNKHKRMHTDEKPFSCDICNYSCADKKILKRHQQRHTGERPCSCDICNVNFSNKDSLKRHHKRKHMDERPFSCELCEFTCSLLYDLTRHKRNHTDVKLYKYSWYHCEYTSATSYHLKRHKKNTYR